MAEKVNLVVVVEILLFLVTDPLVVGEVEAVAAQTES